MLTRRGFMLGSAGLVTGLALTRFLGRTNATLEGAACAHRDAGPLAVGYWAGAEDHAPLRVAAWTGPCRRRHVEASAFRADVVPADRLASGDPRFAETGARLAVKGTFEAEHSMFRPALESLAIDVLFDPVPGGVPETVACHAWSLTRNPVTSASAAVTLQLPVDRSTGVGMTVARSNRAPGLAGRVFQTAVRGSRTVEPTRWTQSARWTLASEPGVPRLRRGVYFVACADRPGRAAPEWESYQFAPCDGAGGPSMLVRRGAGGFEPADFDYVVVAVDHADAEIVATPAA